MKTSFNLKSFRKHAYYDGGRGLTQEMTRACMNCQKEKREKGVGAQEAWFSCIDEYNNQKNGEWSLKYASKKAGLMKKAEACPKCQEILEEEDEWDGEDPKGKGSSTIHYICPECGFTKKEKVSE